jgi:hypothetical protein
MMADERVCQYKRLLLLCPNISIGLTTSRAKLEAIDGNTMMVDEVEALKARRAELERQVATLESDRIALYMPGITLIPQEGLPADDAADQQLAHLRTAIVEIDTQLATFAARCKQ